MIYIVHVHVDLNFSVARDERYITRAMFLRRLAATYELHWNNSYVMTSRVTQQQ